jgi:Transposase
VWAAPGHDATTLGRFFDALGQARCQQVRLVSAEAAEWIATVVAERCPKQGSAWTRSTSPEWATDALDQVRREVWNAARKNGEGALARELKGARYAPWKNPGDLTARQRAKPAWIAQVNDRLYRAYLLKEELRLVFTLKGVWAMLRDTLDGDRQVHDRGNGFGPVLRAGPRHSPVGGSPASCRLRPRAVSVRQLAGPPSVWSWACSPRRLGRRLPCRRPCMSVMASRRASTRSASTSARSSATVSSPGARCPSAMSGPLRSRDQTPARRLGARRAPPR